MEKITQLMNMYRECARNLWNVYFLQQTKLCDSWNVQDEFSNICAMIFSSIVLAPINRSSYKKSRSYEQFPEPLMFLHVIPSVQVPIKINRDIKCTGYWDYPVKTIKSKEVEMRFIDLFDFDLLTFRDFEYYRVRIADSEKNPDLVGRDALLTTRNVEIFCE